MAASNGNASAFTVHKLHVRFTDEETGAVITDVTEWVQATIPGGAAQALTFTAPAAVGDVGVPDVEIGVTVTGWS